MRALIFWLVVILLLILVSNLTGCYSESKARGQFSRAVVAYPEILPKACIDKYPAKDSLIKGDTVQIISTDTLWGLGETRIDTVFQAGKPYEVTRTIIVPGKTIIETRLRVDTVEKESIRLLAALDLANINLTRSLALSDEKTKEADKWRKIAKKRFWVILGLSAGIALGVVAMARKKMAKKLI